MSTKEQTAKEVLSSMTDGQHQWHVEGSTATFAYTDADVVILTKAYTDIRQAEDSVNASASTLVRIFGEAWTKADADKEARTPVREFLRAILPDAQDVAKRAHQYAASSKALGPNIREANSIREDRKSVEARISRIISGAATAWQAHQAAQDPDFKAPQKNRKERTASVILDDVVATLEERAKKGKTDEMAAKMAAAVIRQLPERSALFMAVMKFGAANALKDDAVISVLRFVSTNAVATALEAAKAQAEAQQQEQHEAGLNVLATRAVREAEKMKAALAAAGEKLTEEQPAVMPSLTKGKGKGKHVQQ